MAQRRSVLLGAAVAAGLALPAAAADLLPHRAIYDVSLGSVEASASIVTASGRLAFELTGSACKGYTVNSRFVTRVTDREGGTRTTDLRSSTHETLEPATFSFVNETRIDDAVPAEVNGKAEAKANGLTVSLASPKETTVELPRAVFPTAHTRLILESAAAGDRVLEASVFDGGDTADTLYNTTTVIGPPTRGLRGADTAEVAALAAVQGADALTAHRLAISYFAARPGDGEPTPDYEITFTVLDNGISYDVSFDYGTFSLTGRLTELTLLEATPCNVPQ